VNWKTIWNTLRTNPYAVAAWTAFAGGLVSELYTAIQTGSFDWSPNSWKKMVTAAIGTAVIAVYHLLMPSPTQQKSAEKV
jgi:hypothetical protein